MKKIGIVFFIIALLNLIVAFIAIGSNAPTQAITAKFNAFGLFTILGGILYYFGNKKTKDKDASKNSMDVTLPPKVETNIVTNNGDSNSTTEEETFDSLYEELSTKCNPANFMQPYDFKKVAIANDIYSQLEANKENLGKLKELRERAISELGLAFPPIALYKKLCKLYNPINFTGGNYDAQKLSIVNDLFDRIQNNKFNPEELEKIEIEGKNKLPLVEITTTPSSFTKNILYYFAIYISIVVVLILAMVLFFCQTEVEPTQEATSIVVHSPEFLNEYMKEFRDGETGCSEMLYSECVDIDGDTIIFDKGGVATSPFNTNNFKSYDWDTEWDKMPVVVFHKNSADFIYEGKKHTYNIKQFKGYNSVCDASGCIITKIISDDGDGFIYARYYFYSDKQDISWFICKIDGEIYNFTYGY